MDIHLLCSPITEQIPCGYNIRTNTDVKNIYFDLKDARNNVRRYERNLESISGGESISLWEKINKCSINILSEHSKDLEVLCWLIEAQLRVRGYIGLDDALQLTTNVIERYWEELHSVGNECIEERIAPLAGLSGSGGNGVLIQALRLVPIVPNAAHGKYGLWDYQRSQRSEEKELRDEIYQAAMLAGRTAMSAHLETVLSCINRLNNLSAILDRLCGENAPSTSSINDILHATACAIRDITAADEFTSAAEEFGGTVAELLSEQSVDMQEIQQDDRQNGGAGQIHSRDEALKILFAVAHYFRRTEPHSPIAPVLETLVRRGRMNFQELLTELLPDRAMRVSILTAVGIHTAEVDE